MAAQVKSIDMTRGTIWKQLIQFAVPTLIGYLFQQLYSTVDSIVVGQFVSKEALAAVGSTGNVINALIGFFTGLGMGGGVVISQLFGAKDEKGVHDAVHTTMFMTIILAVFCTFFGIVMTKPMLAWMSTPDDVIGDAATYLKIYFAGVSGMMVYNVGSGILRAVGDSKRPLYFLIFSALLNLGLDLLFVCAFGMGIEGVAYATILSQFISSILILRVLMKSGESYRLVLKDLKISWPVLGRVMRIGLPAAVQTGLTSFSNVFVQAYINAFGADCMAGWTSYSKLDAFIWLPMMCIGLALTTFVGQNLGAGNVERAKKGVNVSIRMAFASTFVVIVIVMALSTQLLQFFNGDPEVLRYGRMFVLWMSPFYLPYCSTQIYSGALRGAGDSLSPMIITLSSFVAFRWLYLIIGTKFIDSALFVGMGYPAGWLVSSAAMFIMYKRTNLSRRADVIARRLPAEEGVD